MEGRLIVAYGLIALMAIFALGLIVWMRYNSFERKTARQRLRDDRRYEMQRAAREADEA